MAIGRISGPMLFSNLERQGLDLSIDGNLIYFDVNRKRIGINTSSPEYDVHITGAYDMQANVFVNGKVIASTLSVHEQYTLPNVAGSYGTVLTSNGAGEVVWRDSSSQLSRKHFSYHIADLPQGGYQEFIMDIGVANIVYGLTVNRPCIVEVFSTASKNESNPYTFLATLDHLTDDGTVLLSDGSVIQQRQYSIFINQETPPQGQVYARITNIDGVPGPIDVSLTYLAAVSETKSNLYETNVVSSLPIEGYTGQTMLNSTDGKMYVWYNNTWNSTS